MSIVWTDTVSPASVNVSSGDLYGWMLDAFHQIHKYDAGSWTPFTGPSGVTLTFLAAGSDGTLLGLDGSTNAYIYSVGFAYWSTVSLSTTLVHGSVGSQYNVLVVDTAGTIHEISSTFDVTFLSSTGMDRVTTATTTATGLWTLTPAGDIYSYDGTSFNNIPGQLTQVHISPNGSRVIGVNSVNGSGWQYNFATSSWLPVSRVDGTKDFARIEAGDSSFWCQTTDGMVYRGV